MSNLKINFNTLLLSFLFLIFPLKIKSQIDYKSLEFNTVQKNIFQRPITTMVIDNDGFLWIGTEGAGLYRYNGFSYSYYGHNIDEINSINSNAISSLFVDDDTGLLWVGTDAGLCVYNKKQNSFNRFEPKNEESLDNNNVNILSFAKYKNKFLVGTYDGIKELNLKKGTFDDYGLSGFTVLDLEFSTKGNLYIATNKGLKLEQYHQRGKIEDIALQGDNVTVNVTKLHIDKRENLWVGTLKNGAYKVDLNREQVTFSKLKIPDSSTMSIVSDSNNVLIAVENGGLFVLNMRAEVVKHYQYNVENRQGIGSNSIWAMLLDNQNRLWLGYYENGLGFVDAYHNKFTSIQRGDLKNSIYTNDIKAFAKTNSGKIWIAQINGIDILDSKTNTITNVYGSSTSNYKGLKKDLYIENIFIDSKENIWLATWGNGVFLLKKGSSTFINFTKESTLNVLQTNKVTCFTEDSDGNVWIGTFLEGVYYYDRKVGKIQRPTSKSYIDSEIINKDVKVILHDSSGFIWVGTTSGLYHIEKHNKNEYVVTNHNKAISDKFAGHPSSSRILDIYETLDGTVWFGTNGGGLFQFKRDQKDFERLELKGFDLSFVNAIYEPLRNELWVSSKQGVLKINRQDHDVTQFTVYDGLLKNFLIDGAILMDDKNVLYLGTKNGINTIEPQQINYNPYKTKPYLKGIKLFNKEVNQSDENSPLSIKDNQNILTLDHNQSVITIDYESISFTRPEKNQYAYRLEGFEKNWNFVGAKTNATYTNLEPGNYTFNLKASNNDNIWNEASTILKIQILPPWWQTIWAYILYLILLSSSVFIIMHYYKKRVSELNTFRLERERRKQKVDLQQQKLQFFTNISHEFRTPLTLIINPIKDLIESTTLDFPKPVQQKHHIIHKNAERLSRLINELMDFRKLQSNKLQLKVSQFNLVKNTKNILSFFNEESKRRGIQLDIKFDNVNLDVWADSGILDKVLFNLLSNAFKVTPNKGKIRVKIVSKKTKILPLISNEAEIPVVEINVKDNGPGIDQKDYKKIFDRFYQISELNKTYYGSTGVGLEMVNSFIKLHKGVVEVESELGKGSVFKVFIPFGKEFFESNSISMNRKDSKSISQETTINNESKKYTIEEILSDKESKKKILIAEDNTDLQDYLISILEQDYELILALDGQEAWLKTMEYRPDIIITDVIMPIMGGIEFCEKVKKDSALSHIPVIMLTAKNLTEDRIKGMKVGAEAYLVKPFETKELLVVVEQLLLKKDQLLQQYSNVLPTPVDKKENEVDNDFIQKVLDFIDENIENPSLNVQMLTAHLYLSRSQVYRKIKTLTGLSPIEFIRRIRLERSRTIFQNDKNLNVSEVAYKVGFLSASYFTTCYKKQYGELPKSKKK